MKKLLILAMALAMTLSLAACGDNEETPSAPQSNQQASSEQPSAEVPADQVEGEQAKADADYAQLNGFMTDLQNHQELMTKNGELTEKVKAGTATTDELLASTKELADDSGSMVTKIEEATWQTEYYAQHVEALTNAVASLAAAEELTYQAGSENDESKLEQVPTFFAAYDEQLGVLLDLLGAAE